jgi:hypothetical protein
MPIPPRRSPHRRARRCDRNNPMILPGKKLGLYAFVFFFVKGLLWLLVPAALYTWGC